jgi:uncharacterized iron-regulated membrane protein
MYTALSVLALVLSIVASIVGIVAHWRLRRVEKKLIEVTTHGANSPIFLIEPTGGTNSITVNVQTKSVTLQPPTTTSPTTVSFTA